MSNARRERLLNLQKREKLKALLVKKFRMQYGTSRQMTQVITKAIEQFVTRKKVTEKDLDVLGKQLDAAAKQLGIAANKSIARSSRRSSRREPQQPEIKAISQPISTPGNSALLSTNNGPQFSTLSQSASAPALRSSRKKTGKLEPLKNAPRTPLKQGGEEEEEVEEDWSLIFRYQQKKAGDDTLKERLKFKKVREDTLKSLRQMTEEKQKLHAKAKKYDDDYAASIQQNMKKWKREEDEKIARRKAAIKKQSEIRRRQMEERKARADKEKADQLKWETNLMRRLNRESQMQQERERRKIIEDKKRLINFLAGNAEVRKRKEAIRAREREEDVKRMKEYARILEKQENARKEYFAKRGEKQAKFMQANVEARKDEFESIRAIELRDLRYQKEKEDADLAKEREAKLRRKKNQDNINKWLNDTIQLKAEKKKKEKESYIEINNYAKKKAAEVSLTNFPLFFNEYRMFPSCKNPLSHNL